MSDQTHPIAAPLAAPLAAKIAPPAAIALPAAWLERATPSLWRKSRIHESTPVLNEIRNLFPKAAAASPPLSYRDQRDGPSLLHEQARSAWLLSFVDPENPSAPSSAQGVMDDLVEIWKREPYVTSPDVLTRRLLRKYLPHNHSLSLFKDILEARLRDPEPLTKGRRKQHQPLQVAITHLNAILTDTPSVLIRWDMIGMSSLNEHNRKLLAAAKNVSPEQIDIEEAKSLTDEVTRGLIGVALEALKDGAHDLGLPITTTTSRSGGDEIDTLVRGLTPEQARYIHRHYVEPAWIDYGANLFLFNQEHCKDRDNPLRRIMGIGAGVMSLSAQTCPGRDRVAMEKEIDENKTVIGAKVTGFRLYLLPGFALPPDAEAPAGRSAAQEGVLPLAHAWLTERINLHRQRRFFNNGTDELPSSDAPVTRYELGKMLREADPHLDEIETFDDATLQSLAALHYADVVARGLYRPTKTINRLAKTSTARLPGQQSSCNLDNEERALSPYTDGEGGILLPHVAQGVFSARQTLLTGRYRDFAAPPRSLPPPVGEAFQPSLLFITPMERDKLALEEALKQESPHAAPETLAYLDRILASFNPTDHAAQTHMGYTIPPIFGTFARDAARLREETGFSDLKSYAVCASMEGLSGINALLVTHENANIVLCHVARNIVEKGFDAAGIPADSIEIGHLGGGHLAIATRPLVKTAEEGYAFCVTEQHIEHAIGAICHLMEDFRQTPVAAFMRDHGGLIPDTLDEAMTFGDIPDPRHPATKGAAITCAFLELTSDQSGGQLLDTLVKTTEKLISDKRKEAEIRSHRHKQKQQRLRYQP